MGRIPHKHHPALVPLRRDRVTKEAPDMRILDLFHKRHNRRKFLKTVPESRASALFRPAFFDPKCAFFNKDQIDQASGTDRIADRMFFGGHIYTGSIGMVYGIGDHRTPCGLACKKRRCVSKYRATPN